MISISSYHMLELSPSPIYPLFQSLQNCTIDRATTQTFLFHIEYSFRKHDSSYIAGALSDENINCQNNRVPIILFLLFFECEIFNILLNKIFLM